jgi:DNA polymerase-1
MGVRPDQFTDLKALIGDTSDNIPGVPGIGPKTAAALLARHGTIDALYALYALYAALPTRQANLLHVHQERVALNRRLVTIVTTVDVSTDLEGYCLASAGALDGEHTTRRGWPAPLTWPARRCEREGSPIKS